MSNTDRRYTSARNTLQGLIPLIAAWASCQSTDEENTREVFQGYIDADDYAEAMAALREDPKHDRTMALVDAACAADALMYDEELCHLVPGAVAALMALAQATIPVGWGVDPSIPYRARGWDDPVNAWVRGAIAFYEDNPTVDPGSIEPPRVSRRNGTPWSSGRYVRIADRFPHVAVPRRPSRGRRPA